MIFHKSYYYFIILFILVIIGFWQSYFSKFLSGFNVYIHFHTLTMLLWLVMLITQAFLIKNKNRSLHKKIGKFSYGLVPLIIIGLILLAHNQLTIRDPDILFKRNFILFLQLSTLAIFVFAYVMAIIKRKSPMHHARYMISTALTMVDPAVARILINTRSAPYNVQLYTFGLVDLILIVLIISERNQKQAREVFPLMLVIFMFFQLLNLTWYDSGIWRSFYMWFIKLPLT